MFACLLSANRSQLKGCQDLSLKKGQNLAVTVLYVPHSLEIGTKDHRGGGAV